MLQDKLDAAYDIVSSALMAFTRAGGVIGLAQPSTLADGTRNTHVTLEPSPTVKSVYEDSVLVRTALESLGLVSNTLNKFIDALTLVFNNDRDATIAPYQHIAGVDQSCLIHFSELEINDIVANMVLLLGVDAAKSILELSDQQDRLLMLSFIHISLVSRGSVLDNRFENAPTVNIEEWPQRKGKVVDMTNVRVSSANILDLSSAEFKSWNAWGIDYKRLKDVFARENRTTVSVDEMSEVIALVAPALNVPVQAIETVLFLECGWPEHIGRNKSGYSASMTRDDGSRLYRGVTQASIGFWIDVSGRARSFGIRMAPRPELGTIAEQIAAPFIYLDRYRNSPVNGVRLTEWPLTPGLVYSFHQQSRGGQGTKFQKIANEKGQSGVSVNVIRATAAQYRKPARTVFL